MAILFQFKGKNFKDEELDRINNALPKNLKNPEIKIPKIMTKIIRRKN